MDIQNYEALRVNVWSTRWCASLLSLLLTYPEHVQIAAVQGCAKHFQGDLLVELQAGNQVLVASIAVWHPVREVHGVLQSRIDNCQTPGINCLHLEGHCIG